MRSCFNLVLSRLMPTVIATSILSLTLFVGCAEPTPERTPEDKEKARQEHINQMQQERGQN